MQHGGQMVQFIVRAAQSAFNEAGYTKDEAYRLAQMVVCYMLRNLAECRAAYGITDEFELAYYMARDAIDVERLGQPFPFSDPIAA